MKRKLVSLLLTVSMAVALLAGCASTEEPETDNLGTESEKGMDKESGETEEQTNKAEKPEEIVVALMCSAPIDTADSQHVEDKLNEILLEKLNVQADFQWYAGGTYITTAPMMLNSGEQLDLMMFMPVAAAGYQSFMLQNQLMDIAPYLKEYGQDIMNTVGEYVNAISQDGAIYGVGNNTSLKASLSIVMRKDVLDDLGLTEKAQNMTTWAEYEEILKEVVTNTDLHGIVNSDAVGTVMTSLPYLVGGEAFAEARSVDIAGDSFQQIYIDSETDKVKCYYESEEWLEGLKRVRRFYEEGLIYKDAGTAQDYGASLIKNDVGFSYITQTELGAAAATSSATGKEMIVKDITPAKVTTQSITKFGFAVPVTSKHPEAAVKVLNLMYSDQDFLDTMVWGVEGVDWVKTENGQADYPEGVTADTVKYHTAEHLYGDRLKVTPWVGNDPDIRKQQNETNGQMERSKYLGFNVDPTNITNTVTACKNVIDQYKPMLTSGAMSDVEATNAEFVEALYGAGMQDIIDEYQSQLDAWLLAQ